MCISGGCYAHVIGQICCLHPGALGDLHRSSRAHGFTKESLVNGSKLSDRMSESLGWGESEALFLRSGGNREDSRKLQGSC